jgi:hypothetical protein
MHLAALMLLLAAAPGPGWKVVDQELGFVGFDGEAPFAETTIEVPNVKIRLLISAGKLPVGRDAVREWVETNANAVARYYGVFPGEEVTVTVLTGGRGLVDGGTTFGGRAIRINVGTDATRTTLEQDWRMGHELLHVAFADLDDDYQYLEEGLSTYLEPIVRAQAGLISTERVWGDLVDGLPKGMPGVLDRGMDRNHSWGTLYWGGARFWLMAELGIRQKTAGKKSLRDALRAIYTKGGNGRVHLDLDRMIALGDAATGTRVLEDLHAQMGMKKDALDLTALWKQLGVEQHGDLVTFHDDAPLAATRIAITRSK